MSAAHPLRHPWRLLGLIALAAVAAVTVSLAPASPARATPSIADLEQQIRTSSQQFEKVVEQYNKVNDDKKKTKTRITALDKKIKPLAAKVAMLRQQVGRLAETAYKGGSASAWNSLLAGTDTNLVDGIATLDRVSAQQTKQVHDLVTTKHDLDQQRAEQSSLYTKQAKQSADLKAKKAKIAKQIDKLKAMREQAYGSVNETSGGSSAQPPNVSGRAGAVVSFAYAQLGKPYVWAAAGPDSYDCSGLTLAAWRQAGVSLPHVAADQYNQIPHVSRSAVQPGDLVFYENLGHVAIYVGSGNVIHAPTFGEVVKISSIDMMPVYGIGRP